MYLLISAWPCHSVSGHSLQPLVALVNPPPPGALKGRAPSKSPHFMVVRQNWADTPYEGQRSKVDFDSGVRLKSVLEMNCVLAQLFLGARVSNGHANWVPARNVHECVCNLSFSPIGWWLGRRRTYLPLAHGPVGEEGGIRRLRKSDSQRDRVADHLCCPLFGGRGGHTLTTLGTLACCQKQSLLTCEPRSCSVVLLSRSCLCWMLLSAYLPAFDAHRRQCVCRWHRSALACAPVGIVGPATGSLASGHGVGGNPTCLVSTALVIPISFCPNATTVTCFDRHAAPLHLLWGSLRLRIFASS